MERKILIKVCGMRDPANIRQVENLGVDMMGFIFYPRSPRHVPAVPAYMPQGCVRTGVFVDADCHDVAAKVDEYGLGAVQLHGAESAGYCQGLRRLLPAGVKVIKALSIGAADDIDRADAYTGVADYLLFDTRCEGRGGSGCLFDWNLLSRYRGTTPFILSGGISPDSVQALKEVRHPAFLGIDLNSRFETAPAMKDVTALQAFIREIKG